MKHMQAPAGVTDLVRLTTKESRMASRRSGCMARVAFCSGVIQTSVAVRRLTTMYLVACLDLVEIRLAGSH
jgi:hypothetical protein